MNLLSLAGGWALYFTLHSVLAAESVKRWTQSTFPRGFAYYRLFYTVQSVVGLILLMVLNNQLVGTYFFERNGPTRMASIMLTTAGVLTIGLAFRQYRLKAFVGLAAEEDGIRKTGILGVIRHPIYSGLILLTGGFFLFIPEPATLVSCLCILTYLPIGIALEERKLVRHFGQAYLDYKKEVPALVPRWRGLTLEKSSEE